MCCLYRVIGPPLTWCSIPCARVLQAPGMAPMAGMPMMGMAPMGGGPMTTMPQMVRPLT